MPHALIATFWLALALARRFLREGIVLRSLTFPLAITAGTLLMTLGVVAAIQSPPKVAVQPDTMSEALSQELTSRGLIVMEHSDPRSLVEAGEVGSGTDGKTLWVIGQDRPSLYAEAGIRAHLGSPWRPDPGPLPTADSASSLGRVVARLLIAIFSLYGVVFGAGMVARDRDNGTLEVEISLPVPQWVHGAVRWIVGSSVLGLFMLFSVMLFDALFGVLDVWGMVRHGVAATVTTTALGLMSVGRAGIKTGFGSSLAGGLTVTAGLFGIGYVLPELAQYLPLASVLTDGSGWVPLLVTALVGPTAVWIFTRRSVKG